MENMSMGERLSMLKDKWYDFDNYSDRDYREVFNYEAIRVDDFWGDMVVVHDYDLEPTLRELGYTLEYVMEPLKEDLKSIGFKYIAMLGETRKIEEW